MFVDERKTKIVEMLEKQPSITTSELTEGRVSEHQPEKRNLALTAISYIREGDFIALDAGTTTTELAVLIGEHFRELTVLTHSLEIARLLSERENIRIILADSSEFETCAPLKICGLDSEFLWITDSELSDEILDAYQNTSVSVMRTKA